MIAAAARPTRILIALGHAGLALALGLALRPLVGLGYLALVFGGGALRRAWARRKTRGPRRTLSFTREGKFLVAITLGVGVGAINTGNNLLYLMLGMLLSMIIVSGLLSEQTLRALEVERSLPAEIYAGQPFLTGITLINRKGRLPSYSVQIEDVIEGQPAPKRCYFLKIPAGARQETSYRGALPRRGRYAYPRLRAATRFPFGFFVKGRQIHQAAEVVALPPILPARALPVLAQELLGAARRARKGQGREFHGLRDWRTGDDARDIHWTRSARVGRLILREFEQEGARHVGLWLATHVPEGFDEAAQDRLVSVAASLLVHFHRLGFEVELCVEGQLCRIHPDGRGRRPALERLALAGFESVAPPRPPALPPGPAWILLAPPAAAAAYGPGRFHHVVGEA